MLKQIRKRVAWVAKDPFLKDKKEEKGQKVVWEKLLQRNEIQLKKKPMIIQF